MKEEKILDVLKSIPADSRICIIVHYGEIGLKGENRSQFENQLRRNIIHVLSDIAPGSVERSYGRLLVYLPKKFEWKNIAERLKRVFGIANFSLALLNPQDMVAIKNTILLQAKSLEFKSFRITTKRSNKSFPLNSQEISTELGAAVQKETGVAVNLKNPECTFFVEIFNRYALTYANKIQGFGGLPVGVSEKAVSLISSGIDSPVASWKIIKRGVKLIFVHFHSVPATTKASIRNTIMLVRLLTQYQLSSKLYLIPFLPIQEQIMLDSKAEFRVLLYRRSMFRIAEMIAASEGAAALVTGENVGQVASQTLSNIRAISEVIRLPVLRPLAGEDKQEIVNSAKRIGSYDISIEPHEDCCSLYVPRHPETGANLDKIKKIDEQLKLGELYQDALNKAEIMNFKFPV